jgi:hypothetical protein
MVDAWNSIRLQCDSLIENKPLHVDGEIVTAQSDLVGFSGLQGRRKNIPQSRRFLGHRCLMTGRQQKHTDDQSSI